MDFDIVPDKLTVTVGTRYYDITNEMLGANMGSFYCKVYSETSFNIGAFGACNGTSSGYGEASGKSPYGTNLDEQDPHKDTVDGFKSRANLTWKITPDVLVYTTWSEGFRPGGYNRGSNCYLPDVNTGANQWCVPKAYDSDDLTNIELGWKTVLLDRRLQVNGAIYNEKWKNVQTGIFAPQLGLGNLTVGLNGPEYEVNGIELQIVAAPIDGLTIEAAASYNKTKLTNSPGLTNNFGTPETNPNFGEPVTEACLKFVGAVCAQTVDVVNVYGKEGDELANSPKLQWNIRGRYDWDMGEYRPFVMAGVQYQDSSLVECHAGQPVRDALVDDDRRLGRIHPGRVECGALRRQPDGREQEPVHDSFSVHRRRGADAAAANRPAHRIFVRQVASQHGPVGKPAGPSFFWASIRLHCARCTPPPRPLRRHPISTTS